MCALLCPKVPNALIFDIGGGSTEISWLNKREDGGLDVADWCSLPLGVVNLSEKFGGVDVSPEIYEAMKAEVKDAAFVFEQRHALSRFSEVGELQLLGTSGTVTTLAGVHLALARYQRARVDGYRLDFHTMRRISQRIAAMSYDERVAEGCIGPERADLVIAGCAILEALCDLWPSQTLMVADRGLREGILHLIARDARRFSGNGRPIHSGFQQAGL